MYEMARGEIWGGFRDEDEDLCTSGITASLFSRSADGGRGGDIYYLSVCGEDRLTRLAIADVVGHGAPVSRVSEWMYGALESRVNQLEGPAMLDELNQLAVERGIRSMATAALASFTVTDATAYFSYAGHAPVLVCRADEGRWQPAGLASGSNAHENAVLGVVPDAAYGERRERLHSGDRLLAYTDGLVEGRDERGRILGEDGLLELLDAHAAAPLHELKSTLVEEVRRHSGGTIDHDDVTFVAIEVR